MLLTGEGRREETLHVLNHEKGVGAGVNIAGVKMRLTYNVELLKRKEKENTKDRIQREPSYICLLFPGFSFCVCLAYSV